MSEKLTAGPVVLCILDGIGERDAERGNCVRAAKTPQLDALRRDYPHTTLMASGKAMGQRSSRAGDGYLGHRAIGAGRIAPDVVSKISEMCRDNHLDRNSVVDDTLRLCEYNDYALHLIGLVSQGHAHADLEHLIALIELAAFREVPVFVHAILDGCDSEPRSALDTLRQLSIVMEGKNCTLATVSGRYYAMDRDLRWERTYAAFHAMVRDSVLGEPANEAESAYDAITLAYSAGLTDEMVLPTRLGNYRGMKGDFMCDFSSETPEWQFHAEAAGICFNTRSDGAHQLAAMLKREVPPEIARDLLMDRKTPVIVFEEQQLATMTRYGEELSASVLFEREPLNNTLGQVIADNGLKQLRCAESEVSQLVTEFFGGDRFAPFPGEERKLIPSPKLVDRYHEEPAMSARMVGAAAKAAIEAGEHDFILVNFCNAEVIARSGKMDETIEAVEVVDEQLGVLLDAVRAAGGTLLVTSSHGRCEDMKSDIGEALPAQTSNPVPFIYVNDDDSKVSLRSEGSLADVAPTVLEVLGLAKPEEMTGASLRVAAP